MNDLRKWLTLKIPLLKVRLIMLMNHVITLINLCAILSDHVAQSSGLSTYCEWQLDCVSARVMFHSFFFVGKNYDTLHTNRYEVQLPLAIAYLTLPSLINDRDSKRHLVYQLMLLVLKTRQFMNTILGLV